MSAIDGPPVDPRRAVANRAEGASPKPLWSPAQWFATLAAVGSASLMAALWLLA